MSAPLLKAAEAEDFFAALYRGKHHIPDEKVRADGSGVFSVSHYGGIATYDYDEITRMVLLSHERGIRLWIQSGGPRRLRIYIQRRDPSAEDISHGHPTIETAIEKFRTADDTPWWRFYQSRQNGETK